MPVVRPAVDRVADGSQGGRGVRAGLREGWSEVPAGRTLGRTHRRPLGLLMSATWDDRPTHAVLLTRSGECGPLNPCLNCQAYRATVRALNRAARRLGRRLGRSRRLAGRYRGSLQRWAEAHCVCGDLYDGPSIECPAHGCWDQAHEASSGGDPCPRCGSRYQRA